MLKRLSAYAGSALVLATALTRAETDRPPAQIDAQLPPEVTFRTVVNYVEEDVRVVDGQGRFVTGLKQEDFQLTEDGKPQRISTFGMVDIPLRPVSKPRFAASDSLPIEPDVGSNEQILDGRLYLILMDDYHVAPLRTQNARNLARRFVLEKVGANDQAAVITTSGLPNASQDFTQNRHLLVRAIDNFVGQKLDSATLNEVDQRARQLADQRASDVGVQPLTPADRTTADQDAPERLFKARAALNSIRSIAEWMSAIQGRRKAIVYISEGVDYNLYSMFTAADPSQFNFENFNVIQQETWDTVSAASRSNVQIYPIDPRGLTNMGQENIQIQGLPLPALHLGPETLAQELQTSQMNLRQLAEETGGVAAVGDNDLNRAMDRIVEENSTYYVLGYYPTNDKRDGKLRRIAVKVNGYPDAQVMFRRRYAAPRGRPTTTSARPADSAAGVTADLLAAIASPLPKTGLPLWVTAIPQKGGGKMTDVEILVETSGKTLTFTQSDGTFNDTLSLQIGLFDKNGKSVAAERPDINLALKPETHSRLVQGGVRILRRLSVAPGQYQLRIALQDQARTRQGSAHLDVEAPDFGKDAIALGGVAIAATASRSLAYALPQDPFNGGLPALPTTLREFPTGSEFTAFVQVYDNQPAPSHRLEIMTVVRSDDGRAVFSHRDERRTEELHGTAGGFDYSVRVPMAGWAPGLYVLSIDARSGAAEQSVSRVLQFRVVPPTSMER